VRRPQGGYLEAVNILTMLYEVGMRLTENISSRFCVMSAFAVRVAYPRYKPQPEATMYEALAGSELSAKMCPFLADKENYLNTIGCNLMSISVIDLRHGRLKSK